MATYAYAMEANDESPTRREAEVHIEFDRSQVDLDKLFKVEELLREMGLHFDTGASSDVRDWEWDWSLKGPVKVYFRRFKE